jgi:hypothetical protein
MSSFRPQRSLQFILALVALLFGAATLFSGGRVLGGADPGYVVFRPLLLYNTGMGLAYVATAGLIWRHLPRALPASLTIACLNLLVLACAGFLLQEGQGVAEQSVLAMALRTGVWLALLVGVAWLLRRRAQAA